MKTFYIQGGLHEMKTTFSPRLLLQVAHPFCTQIQPSEEKVTEPFQPMAFEGLHIHKNAAASYLSLKEVLHTLF